MANHVRSALRLPTLRIVLDAQSMHFSDVLFEVISGEQERYGFERCTVGELGLPETLDGWHPIEDSALAIPEGVLSGLKGAVEKADKSPVGPERALWLELPEPRGLLHIMPWERLLAPLHRLVLRLPNQLVRPPAPTSGRPLRIAVCASASPRSSYGDFGKKLAEIIDVYLRVPKQDPLFVSVFTDSVTQGNLHLFGLSDFWGRGGVLFADPNDFLRGKRSRDTGSREKSSSVTNPWLLWMRDALGGEAVDFVHFVVNGYTSGDEGVIAPASSPVGGIDDESTVAIGSSELNSFLSQIGAWGLALSAPPNNYSRAGLRGLADGIARIRPGVTFTHDSSRDSQCQQLFWFLTMVLVEAEPHGVNDWAKQLENAGEQPTITSWGLPHFVNLTDYIGASSPHSHTEEDQGGTFRPPFLNLDGSSQFAVYGRATSSRAWLASAARVLEAQQMRWLPDSPETQTDWAAVRALRRVRDMITEQLAEDVLPRDDTPRAASTEDYHGGGA